MNGQAGDGHAQVDQVIVDLRQLQVTLQNPQQGFVGWPEIVLDLLEVASRRLLHRWTESM